MTTDVAIVSPHDEIRLLLRGLLKLHHFRVIREGSSPAALTELLAVEHPVVVLDADLDEVGWSEAIRAFRTSRPDLRLVLLTATRSPRVGGQAKASGIAAVVHRPFAVHDLIDAVVGSAPAPREADLPAGPAGG